MDQSSQGRRSPLLLGLFLQHTSSACRRPQIYGLPTPRFLPISNKGKELEQGKWGTLDASLSFIGKTVYIRASSGGFLLCCYELENGQHYCICNPVTSQWRDLPTPNKVHQYAALSFSCRGGETSLEQAHFRVIRAIIPDCKDNRNLEIETFCSEIGEWRESTLTCDRPFSLVGCNRHSLEIDQVMYWWDTSCRLLAYLPTTIIDHLELIEPPPGNSAGRGSFHHYSYVFGKSQGRILFARHDREYLEVWVLDKDQYSVVTRVNIGRLFERTMEPQMLGKSDFDLLGIKAIHPNDYRVLMLSLNNDMYWCNVESRKLEKFSDSSANVPLSYFLYEWPSRPVTH